MIISILLPFPKHLRMPDTRYLVHTLFDYVYIKNCLFIYKIELISQGKVVINYVQFNSIEFLRS